MILINVHRIVPTDASQKTPIILRLILFKNTLFLNLLPHGRICIILRQGSVLLVYSFKEAMKLTIFIRLRRHFTLQFFNTIMNWVQKGFLAIFVAGFFASGVMTPCSPNSLPWYWKCAIFLADLQKFSTTMTLQQSYCFSSTTQRSNIVQVPAPFPKKSPGAHRSEDNRRQALNSS